METIRSWVTRKSYFKQRNNEKQERALTKGEAEGKKEQENSRKRSLDSLL